MFSGLRRSWFQYSGKSQDADNCADTDVAPGELQETDVLSTIPPTRVPMPYTRSETAERSNSTVKNKRQSVVSYFLDQQDHMPEDPIELSSEEDDHYKTPSSRPFPKHETKPSNSCRSSYSENPIRPKSSNINSDESRLLGGDRRRPEDAVSIPEPTNSYHGLPMPKSNFIGASGGKPFKPRDTLRGSPQTGKDHFRTQVDNTISRPLPSHPGKASSRPVIAVEPPRKKLRVSNESSPDIIQQSPQTAMAAQGSRSRNRNTFSSPSKPHFPAVHMSSDSLRRPSNNNIGGSTNTSRSMVNTPFKPLIPTNVQSDTAMRMKQSPQAMTEISSDEDDMFTKIARERRVQDKESDVEEISRSQVVNSHNTRRKGVTRASRKHRDPSTSPGLAEIIPNSLIEPTTVSAASPDTLQAEMPSQKLPSQVTRNYGPTKTAKGVQLFRLEDLRCGNLVSLAGYTLAVDKNTGKFDIGFDDNNLSTDPVVPAIPLRKIIKVIHGEKNSHKLWIKMSQTGRYPKELGVQLGSFKLVIDLVKLLQTLESTIDVVSQSDDRLDRMFNKTLTKGVNHSLTEQPADERCFLPTIDPKRDAGSPYFMGKEATTSTDRRNSIVIPQADGRRRSSGEVHAGANGKRVTVITALEKRQSLLQADYDHSHPADHEMNGESITKEPLNNRASANSANPITKTMDRTVTSLRSLVNPARTTRSGGLRGYHDEPIREKAIIPSKTRDSLTGKLGDRWKESLTFPNNGKKRVTVDFDDLYRLDNDEFLNDNLVAFFLRYIEHSLDEHNPEVANRLHFFNSYFYEKLRQNPKDKKSINYDGVKKWTAKINIFSREFIIVPINENLHWYVAIICNLPKLKDVPGEEGPEEDGVQHTVQELSVKGEPEENTQKSLAELSLSDVESKPMLTSDQTLPSSGRSESAGKKKGRRRKPERRSLPKYPIDKPSIITLDSLGLPRYNTVNALKQFIIHEGRERANLEIDINDIQGVAAKDIPMQGNYSDCGLFVCAYMERFATNPSEFKRSMLQREAQQWPELHSEDLRSRMRDMIMNLQKKQDRMTLDGPFPDVGHILLPPLLTARESAVYVENDKDEYEIPASSEEASHPSSSGVETISSGPGDQRSTDARRNSPAISIQDNEDAEPSALGGNHSNPKELAEMLRRERSPEDKQERSESVSTDFLTGDRSFIHNKGVGPPDDDTMLLD